MRQRSTQQECSAITDRERSRTQRQCFSGWELNQQPMPSSKYGRSVRRLLLVIVFQLGMCLVVLDDVVNAARGYGEFGIPEGVIQQFSYLVFHLFCSLNTEILLSLEGVVQGGSQQLRVQREGGQYQQEGQ